MEKIKRFFSNNLGWKILSLLISIFIWFLGMNINNPSTTQTFVLPLEMRNLSTLTEKQLILLNSEILENQKIEIKVRGSRNDIQELQRNSSTIKKPYIDFGPIDISSENNIGEKFYITVHKPELGAKYDVLDTYPRTVEVMLDKEIEVEKNIEVKLEGDLEEEYIVAGNFTVEPSSIIIKGASSIVNNIDEVAIYPDITGKVESFETNSQIFILDRNKNDITKDLSLSTKDASVGINILKHKIVPVNKAETIGSLKSGYRLGNITYSQEVLEIVGSSDDVDKVFEINIEAINLDDKEASFVVIHDLEKIVQSNGGNVSVRNGTPKNLKISVEILEYVTQTFEVPTENLEIKGLKDNMVLAPTFTLVLSGIKEDIENFDVTTIEEVLDLRNFDKEKGPAYLEISLDERYSVKNTPYVYVEVINQEEGFNEEESN